MELKKIISEFNISGKIDSLERINKGLINTTYLIQVNQKRYILQKINTAILKDITGIMKNIEIVGNYLKHNNYQYELLEIIKTKDNTNIFYDAFSNPWRCYKYIRHKKYLFEELNEKIIFEFGKAIGHFHACLAKFNSAEISSTIIDFHNTKRYYNKLKKLIDKGKTKKTEDVRDSLMFIDKFKHNFEEINNLIKSGRIPIRVCHNDTKIDNILFEENGKNVKGIIDLDTIMGNSIIYDFGDAIRTSCNTRKESDKQIDKINFEFKLFKSFTKGYLSESKIFICKTEKELLAFSPILVALEQAIRFFIDYLKGDKYYKINHPKQNLERGLNQIAFAKKMLLREEEMKTYINAFLFYKPEQLNKPRQTSSC